MRNANVAVEKRNGSNKGGLVFGGGQGGASLRLSQVDYYLIAVTGGHGYLLQRLFAAQNPDGVNARTPISLVALLPCSARLRPKLNLESISLMGKRQQHIGPLGGFKRSFDLDLALVVPSAKQMVDQTLPLDVFHAFLAQRAVGAIRIMGEVRPLKRPTA